MWEIIAENRRKSIAIFSVMGIFLLTLGYFIGQSWWGIHKGGIYGFIISGMIWIGWSLISYYYGDSLILTTTSAQEVTKEVSPQLYNIVDEMRIAANLHFMPRIFIIDSAASNAFATGRDPEHSSIVVTRGLMTMLSRDELQGVIAHEISHIVNRDILLLTFAGVLVGAVQIIADLFLRRLRFSDFNPRYSMVQLFATAAAIILAVLAPLITMVLYFAVSRKREYLADALAVRLTRYPEGLAAALDKLRHCGALPLPANHITTPLFICNPLKMEEKDVSDWTDTHPPIGERIRILRSMLGSAAYSEYQNAYQRIKSGELLVLPSDKYETDGVAIRKGNPNTQPLHDGCGGVISGVKEAAAGKVQADSWQISGMSNSRIIVPNPIISNEKKSEDPAVFTNSPPQEYIRTRKTWQMIQCEVCGANNEISPSFRAPFLSCHQCSQKILVEFRPEQK